jgi:hypothetical protein
MMSRYEGGDHQAGSNDAQVLRAERHPREHVTAVSEDDRSHKVTLTVPLSVCTADLGHLPSKDIEKWFARKASVRHKAVNKKGRIPRPLNAFMLYRSAFIERARAWCGQNKQQFLSQVIATSWRMESADVQQRYKRYAERERLNHYKAHPTYKFSPRRPDSAGRKGQERFIEDQHSDLPLESNEQERLPTTINSSVVSKTVDCRAVYRSDFPSLVTPQPSPLETRMIAIRSKRSVRWTLRWRISMMQREAHILRRPMDPIACTSHACTMDSQHIYAIASTAVLGSAQL